MGASHCLDTSSNMQQEENPGSPIQVFVKYTVTLPPPPSGGKGEHRHHLVHPRRDERSQQDPGSACKGPIDNEDGDGAEGEKGEEGGGEGGEEGDEEGGGEGFNCVKPQGSNYSTPLISKTSKKLSSH